MNNKKYTWINIILNLILLLLIMSPICYLYLGYKSYIIFKSLKYINIFNLSRWSYIIIIIFLMATFLIIILFYDLIKNDVYFNL